MYIYNLHLLFASALAASSLTPWACSQFTVIQKKNRRLSQTSLVQSPKGQTEVSAAIW